MNNKSREEYTSLTEVAFYESNIAIEFWLKTTSPIDAGTNGCDTNAKYWTTTKFQLLL